MTKVSDENAEIGQGFTERPNESDSALLVPLGYQAVGVNAGSLALPAEASAVPDRNPVTVYLAGLSPGSRRTMEDALGVISTLLYRDAVVDPYCVPWQALRFQHTMAIRSLLAERYRPATASKMLSALRGVLKTSWRLGLMDGEDYQAASDIGGVAGASLLSGRALAPGELSALMAACCARDAGVAGARDSALLGLLYGCGLRRAELAALDVADFDKIAGTLRVQGKRSKERLVPVVGGAAEALSDWLLLRGEAPGPLFVRIRKGGKLLLGARLTTQAVYHILQVRARAAGVAAFSPHDLRRTFVGDLLEAGADIATVQKLAGHANVQTTARYDRRGEATKKRAAQMLHVPYFKR